MIDCVRGCKKYFNYILFSSKSKLKSEVASSYLNALWLVLNPLFYMLTYMFIVEVVFKRAEPNFPIFVFIGITFWDYFSRLISCSVNVIRDNRNIVTKTYIPKYVLLMVKSFVLLFKMFISIFIIFILLAIFRIKISFNVLLLLPIIVVMYIFTFGCGMILMHFGVYVNDLNDIVRILLRFIFYFSGIFYSITNSLPPIAGNILLKANPIAFFINEARNVLMYHQGLSFYLLIWLIIGLIICKIGLQLIKRNENTYIKVLR